MSAKVEVLCPNGHRVNVKITPNTTILQILEEACLKKGFQPCEDYDLKHGKKVLDVTLSVRYAGLANHAKLELVKAAKSRAAASVLIALQTPDGQRLQHEFPSSTSLMDILQHWENQPDSGVSGKLCVSDGVQHPVCIYMREEVVGEFALRSTTLKKLGLTSGKAIIRLVHRAVDEDTLAKVRADIEKETERVAKLKAKSSDTQMQVAETPRPAASDASSSRAEEAMDCSSPPPPPPEVVQVEKKSEKPSTSNQRPQQNSGVRPKQTTTVQPYQASEESGLTSNHEQLARQIAQQLMPNIFPDRDAGYEARQAELERQRLERIAMAEIKQRQVALRQAQPDFSNFKFPEATKGKDLYKNELSDYDESDFKPCDRETVVYNAAEPRPELVDAGDSNSDLPDNFFDITENDVRMMYNDLQKQIEDEACAPLMTKAMRQANAEARIMSKYDRVILRFHFPDKMVVQALFRPKETVYTLEKFVKELLDNKNAPFYLYTTPPKQVLKDKAKTLIAAELAPMTVVYIGTEEPLERYLSAAVLQESSSQLAADYVIVNHSKKSDSAESHSDARPSTSGSQSHAKRTSTGEKKDPGKVPKWFKMGGKK